MIDRFSKIVLWVFLTISVLIAYGYWDIQEYEKMAKTLCITAIIALGLTFYNDNNRLRF